MTDMKQRNFFCCRGGSKCRPLKGRAQRPAPTTILIIFSIIFFTFMTGFLGGCTTISSPSTQQTLTQAQQSGFNLQRYQTKTFLLTSYQRLSPTPTTIHLYIEGDGNSWKTRYQLSDNPTPKQPLALTLALEDPHTDVIYLARPCQYTPLELDKNCTPKYWSSHRYAIEVIESTNEVLNNIKTKYRNKDFVLIGFSGGGAVAALVATQRKDIQSLITVAGDLNHVALNQYHHTTPLHGSLNPSMHTDKIKNLPQHHLSGNKDKIVPPWLSEQFAQKVNNPACIKVTTLKNVDHHRGWREHWREIINLRLECKS